MRGKEESEKVGLMLNNQKTQIMAFGPITSWQIDGKKMETVRDFIFLGSKITADSDCGHEIKRCLILGWKAMTNLDSTLKKQRHHFADKGLYSQSYIFPVVLYVCESWTLKQAKQQRIDAFKLWYWRRLLRVPWKARWLNQCILKEINLEYSLEGLMLKLKLLILWPPNVKSWLMGKDSDPGKDWKQKDMGTAEDEMVR